jgi:hypothetical protein
MTSFGNHCKTALIAIAAVTLAACSQQPGDSAAAAGTAEAAAADNGTAAGGYQAPRTSWGDPDISGKWPSTAMVGTPMQRDEKLGLRNELTDEELAEREAQFARQSDLDNADFELENAANTPGGAVGGPVSPPPHWLERGEPQRQASLLVDPPNGRMPPLTEQAQQRQAALREYAQSRGPADSYTDRSLYDRCITRGLVGSMMPVIYNNGVLIMQSPGYVTITNEMIHETRVVPLDGRPHVGSAIKQWLGDSRGHWDGDSLVVETTNLNDRANVGIARQSDQVKVTERFTRVDADTLEYRVTVDDPLTYTAPWTMQFPLDREDDYGMFEYACHEGNYAMFNILSGHRADERAAAAAAAQRP